MFASSWVDLTDTTILAPVEVNELGGRPRVDPTLGGKTTFAAWTGTDWDGTSTGDHCGNWTGRQAEPEIDHAVIGELIPENSIDCRWTNRSRSSGCKIISVNRESCGTGNMHHLYCFEQ
jgi:hypothetical protein